MPAVFFCLVIVYFIFSSHSFMETIGGAVVFILLVISAAVSVVFPPAGVVIGFIAYIIGGILGFWHV